MLRPTKERSREVKMRKTGRSVLLLAVVVAALVLSSTAAFAALRMGTDNAETLTGTHSADVINGMGGSDTLKGLAGNDTYHFDDGFGADRLEELATYKVGTKKLAGGNDRVSFTAFNGTNGSRMIIGLVREWATSPCFGQSGAGICFKASEAVSTTLVSGQLVGFASTAPERSVGGTSNDVLVGGKEANVLNGGPGSDSTEDYGGFPGQTGFPALPASSDTIRAGQGQDSVTDFGGTADKLDLRAMGSSDDVYFAPNGSDLVISNSNSGASVHIRWALDASTPRGKMEQIIFTDEVVSGAQAQVQASVTASSNGRLAEMAEEVAEQTPTETAAPLPSQ